MSASLSIAKEINNNGKIVGIATTDAYRGLQRNAVLWWGEQPVIYLGSLGSTESLAFGINETEQIVGSADTTDEKRHAVMWEHGETADLGTLGGENSSANGINETGQIVGDAETDDGVQHAFIYSDGAMHALDTPDGTASSAAAINDHGQIVGQFSVDGNSHATLWEDEATG